MLLKLNARQKRVTTACISIFGVALTFVVGYIPAIILTLFFLSGNRPTTLYALAAATPRDLK